MRTIAEQSPAADELCRRLKTLTAELLSGVESGAPPALVRAGASPLAGDSAPRLLRLTEGSVTGRLGEKAFLVFEEGDLFGVETVFTGLPALSYDSDFAVRVEAFSWASLSERVRSDAAKFAAWSELLAVLGSFFREVAGSALKMDSAPQPEVKWFNEGDVIIAEGAAGPEVFTLVEGHAEVQVDGVKVGEVLPEEIFGALAALTNTPRTASVIATTRTMALAMKRDNFVELMSSRPGTVLKLVEDMARMVVTLNQKVVTLEKKG